MNSPHELANIATDTCRWRVSECTGQRSDAAREGAHFSELAEAFSILRAMHKAYSDRANDCKFAPSPAQLSEGRSATGTSLLVMPSRPSNGSRTHGKAIFTVLCGITQPKGGEPCCASCHRSTIRQQQPFPTVLDRCCSHSKLMSKVQALSHHDSLLSPSPPSSTLPNTLFRAR